MSAADTGMPNPELYPEVVHVPRDATVVALTPRDLDLWQGMVAAAPLGEWFRRKDVICDFDAYPSDTAYSQAFFKLTLKLADIQVIESEGIRGGKRHHLTPAVLGYAFVSKEVEVFQPPSLPPLKSVDYGRVNFDFLDTLTGAVPRNHDASEELPWQDLANCLGVEPDLFFPERGASTREAKKVCQGCVIREDCLEYALSNNEKFGIWGGMSERQRRKIRKQRGLVEVTDDVVELAAEAQAV